MSRTLYLGGALIALGDDTPEARAIRKLTVTALMLRHPDVWHIHKANHQFVEVDGVIARKAVTHSAVQALRARALGWLLKLDRSTNWLLEKAAFLHDSAKGNERRHMQKKGFTWDSYEEAQAAARRSWIESGFFGCHVMDLAQAVGHESLVKMEMLLTKGKELTPLELAMLTMHYLDDISIDSEWVLPAVRGLNVIDARMERNADNPAYATLNNEGRERLPQMAQGSPVAHLFGGGETTYEAQCRVGHRVEDKLSAVIMERWGAIFSPLDLPVIIDNVRRRELLRMT